MASNQDPVHMEEEEDIDNEDMLSDTDGEAGTPLTTSRASGKGKRKASQKSGNKVKRKTTSLVWNHFTKSKTEENKANCHYCGKKMACASSSGTSNMRKHLKSCTQHQAWKETQQASQHVLNPEDDGLQLGLGKVSEAVFREACNEMLVLGELPLSFIDGLAFRHFCNKVKLYQPHSRRTATRNIVEMYVKRKTMMKKLLGVGGKEQRLSLTTDIWVAPNTGASYMVVTAHFIDTNWQMKKEEFSEVGYDSLVLNGEFLHLRCATHILNLIVKDGLKDVDQSVDAIRNGVHYVRSSVPREKSFELRVDTGKISRGSVPLDCKTRWNSTFLMLNRAMDFRVAFDKMKAEDKPYNDYFQQKVDGKKRQGPPGKDDWEAVDRFLNFLVLFYRSTLVLSASTKVCSYKIYNEIVSIQAAIMEMGEEASIQGDKGMQNKVKAMLDKLGKYWDPFNEETEMNRMVIVASVFDPRNKMKFAQLCFDQLYGKDSFKAKEMQDSIMEILKRLFDEYNSRHNMSMNRRSIASSTSTTSSQSQGTGSSSSSQPRDDSRNKSSRMDFSSRLGFRKMDARYKEMVKETGFQETATELELYLAENVENPQIFQGTEFDVLSWWKVNSIKFPVLSQVAKDVLAMQVSSVASESAFSTSGRVLDPYRSCLTHYTIEVLMCLEQWLKTEIRMDNRGSITIEQLLEDIEDQDDLQRKFGKCTLEGEDPENE